MRNRMFLAVILFLSGLASIAQTNRIVSHITNPSGLFKSQIMLVNGTNQVQSYELAAYDTSGFPISTSRGSLTAQHTVFKSITELFQTDAISHFTIGNETGIVVQVRYQLKSGGSPTQVQESRVFSKRWQFFPGDSQTVTDGFALLNMGSTPASVDLKLFEADGSLVYQRRLFEDLAPMAKGLHVIDNDEFPAGEERYFILESSEMSSLMALRFQNPDNRLFWQVPAEAIEIKDLDSPESSVELSILYTNDEHGWMEASGSSGGAAGLMGLWRDQEGYGEDNHYLILSGGDMWTGPAISTWTKGEAMADIMNRMGYSAAALGNHEFDFGLDVLRQRAEGSGFPFISANIRNKETGAIPDFIAPFVILEVDGVNVGIIGLTTTVTPAITFESYTGWLNFLDYESVLQEYVPIVRRHGADIILVVGHVCSFEYERILGLSEELGIDLLTGGHCHAEYLGGSPDLPIVSPGSFLENYGRIDIIFDPAVGVVTYKKAVILPNQGGTPDPDINDRVSYWQAQTEAALGEIIGFASADIPRGSPEMGNMITDSWLFSFPGSQIALSNQGGVRQSILAGDITVGDIIGVLPFDNNIMELHLTGSQIIENILCCNPLLGGMSSVGSYHLLDGTLLQDESTYYVLTTDFLYQSGDGFLFLDQDPDATYSGISWQQPVIDWIRQLNTSSSNPLNQFLDSVARK